MRFDQNAALPPILHLTFFNPLDDHYGQSPLEAAAIAVDTHNGVACWNKALLDNAARPSGALVYAGADGGVLSPVQYERLKKEFTDFYQGANNAGRPLVLDGGLDWRPISLSPRDMDFLEAKHASACEIALAFGVPPMLLGIPGDNTYSNYQEANRVFWRQSVLSVAARIGCAPTHWLSPIFGENLMLSADTGRRYGNASARRRFTASTKNASPRVTGRLKAEMCSNGPTRNKHWAPAVLLRTPCRTRRRRMELWVLS